MSSEPDQQRSSSSDASNGMKWLSGFAALFGAWIALSPFALESTSAAEWNNIVVGVAIFLIAGYNFYRYVDNQPGSVGAMALVGLLGLWALFAPFAFDIGSEELLFSNVVAGVLVALFGGYVANTGRKARAGAPEVTD